VAGRARAADRAVEEDVAGEDVGAVDEEGQVAAGVARRGDAAHLEAGELARRVLGEDVLDRARVVPLLADQLDRAGARPDGNAVALHDLVEVVDVVDVVVREQDALDREVVLLDEAMEVVVGAVAVDPDGGTAGLRGDDIGVSHPLGVLGVVDQHHGSSR